MNPTSPLQQQFPLSSKKFFKKMIDQSFGAIFSGIAFAVLGGGVYLGFNQDHASTPTAIFVALFCFIVGFFVVFIPYAIYVKAYIKRYYYAGEDHFVTIKKGVFTPAEIHVQYQKIQDVYVDQDLIDRIMGLYDVHIASATAASGIEAHIDGVDKATADGLKKFLLDKMAPGSVNSGNGSMGNANIGGASQQQSAQSVSFNFSEELSSAKYPLSSKWFGIEIVNRFVGALLTPLFLVLIFVGKSKNISIADNLGYIGLAYAALFIGIFMWRIISLVLWKKNYAFNFTPEHIYYKDGVISISEKHMPYSSIQDVTVKQGVLDRLFGLADVRIENAATQSIPTGRGQIPVFSGVLLQGLTLVDANKITDILKTTVLGRNSSKYGL